MQGSVAALAARGAMLQPAVWCKAVLQPAERQGSVAACGAMLQPANAQRAVTKMMIVTMMAVSTVMMLTIVLAFPTARPLQQLTLQVPRNPSARPKNR